MRLNENLILAYQKTILVPYKKVHVEQYHEWMKSPFLQEMTASEPLTLEEEYDMQKSWHEDDRKCTFIILALKENTQLDSNMTSTEIQENTKMIGDVNIFLNDQDEDLTFGEIEIMIAEEDYRRSGHGLLGLKMMMAFALKELGLKTFHAKISMKNQPSIQLFEKKLSYYLVSSSEIFQETTLEWSINQPLISTTVSDDDDVQYGSLATQDQKELCQKMNKALIKLWDDDIIKMKWN
ncbi:GNAT domain-containing protein [Cunninghamella echinulata]|nr:GNAT domain-containing protein [Cunninghamella echinulata]